MRVRTWSPCTRWMWRTGQQPVQPFMQQPLGNLRTRKRQRCVVRLARDVWKGSKHFGWISWTNDPVTAVIMRVVLQNSLGLTYTKSSSHVEGRGFNLLNCKRQSNSALCRQMRWTDFGSEGNPVPQFHLLRLFFHQFKVCDVLWNAQKCKQQHGDLVLGYTSRTGHRPRIASIAREAPILTG